MSDAVIVAIVSLVGTIITVLAANKHTLNELDKKSELSDAKIDAKLDRHQAVTDTKLDELTREVRKHNEFATRIPILEEKAKAADRRLTDLEHRQAG